MVQFWGIIVFCYENKKINYLISRIRVHIMHTILTANLNNSIVTSACHYMKEKIKSFQVCFI